MKYTGYIYKISNDINNKIYIGQTNQKILFRFRQHISEAKHKKVNNHFHNAIFKYGKDHFMVESIETIEANSIDELTKQLDEKEIYWINQYDSFYNGYNSTIGGSGTRGLYGELNPFYGKHHTKETLKKLSESHSGMPSAWKGQHFSTEQKEHISQLAKERYVNGFIPTFLGKHHTEETKQKLSKIHKGKVLSEETKRKLSIANQGKTISDWQKQRISEFNKGKIVSQESKKKMSDAHKGKQVGELNPMYGKKQTDETKKKISEAKQRNPKTKEISKENGEKCSKAVIQFTKDGEKFAKYSSMSEANRITNITIDSISKCCNHKPHYHTAGGYIWEYAKQSIHNEDQLAS